MPSINIIEQDLTTGGGRSTNLNVVYVPGFMSIDTNTGEDETPVGAWPIIKNAANELVADTSKAAPARTPILCSNVAEFETYFGKAPARFSDLASGDFDDFDKSYLYAKELLNLGLPVLYESMNSVTETNQSLDKSTIYKAFSGDDNGNLFTALEDKGTYQFKYLTSGGYPLLTNKLYTKAVASAVNRGDCIVLIDHEQDTKDLKAMYDNICTDAANLNGADCCAMFTPWVNINCVTYNPPKADITKNSTFSMPPSFAYLSALAKSIKTNASWLAVAGATRGQIPNLDGSNTFGNGVSLPNALAESIQNRDSISINAITNIKPFGYRIWGNRTLKNNSIEGNLTATSFLNTRSMICDIKKVVYDACKKYTFEQNNDVLWLNFKSEIEPTLDQMKTGAGLSGYKIIKKIGTTEKAKLEAIIKLYPLYAVEDFEITVQMLDDEIAVS